MTRRSGEHPREDRQGEARGEHLTGMIHRRYSRREALVGLLAGSAAVAGAGCLPTSLHAPSPAMGGDPSSLDFVPVAPVLRDSHRVASGYDAQVLIRWGDPLFSDAPPFDPAAQNAAAQERRFGYNNDFLAFLPLPTGSGSSDHGLLFVNHEYTNAELMFPGIEYLGSAARLSADQAEIEMAAHGCSILEIRRDAGDHWRVVPNSPFARRLSPRSAQVGLSGPAAAHPRLRTRADPTGTQALGTLNNCGGGVTPWGTVLSAEENFNDYFSGDASASPEADNHARLGIRRDSFYAWSRFHRRFDVGWEPHEPNRFGWMVEIDPFRPESRPVKRTALGRFKHESAAMTSLADGRIVVYMGDDEVNQYLYRFVSAAPAQPGVGSGGQPGADPGVDRGSALDRGVLSAARFSADGALHWLPLIWGEGPLTPANGFAGPADVLIETRRAAELAGATPMDRPEGVTVNPLDGRLYVMLTNNVQRTPEGIDAPNPRGPNPHGHILEIAPPGAGGAAPAHDAESFAWGILLLASPHGDPDVRNHPRTAAFGSWFAAPDNACIDNRGRLWIATDQGGAQASNGIPDGILGCDLQGAGRGLTKRLFAVPRGAEAAGPAFTPDGSTLFVSVQHPGEARRGSTFRTPQTRWPDFAPDMPPRPAVVAITRRGGGVIGSG